MTLSELKKVDFGKGQSIQTLEELLSFLPSDRWLNLELKKETLRREDFPKIASLLLTHRGHRLTHVSSFEHSALPLFRRSGFQTGMLLGEEHAKVPILALLIRVAWIRPYSMNLPIQGFERLGARKMSLFVGLFRLLGRKLAFWTVNTEAQFRQAAPYVQMLITDEVERARGWVEGR